MHPDGENSGDDAGFRLLPFLLLPLAAGTDAYSADEMLELPEELQLLGAEKEREGDQGILRVLLETLLLLTGSREGRERLREMGAYYVVRECHAALEEVDEEVQEVCDRIVQMLMRDEPAEEEEEQSGGGGVMVVEEVEQGKREERAAGKVDQKAVTEKEVVKTEQTAAEQQPAEQEDSDEDDSITEIF